MPKNNDHKQPEKSNENHLPGYRRSTESSRKLSRPFSKTKLTPHLLSEKAKELYAKLYDEPDGFCSRPFMRFFSTSASTTPRPITEMEPRKATSEPQTPQQPK